MNLPSLRSLAAVAATSLLVGGLGACGSKSDDNSQGSGTPSSASAGSQSAGGSSGASASSGSSVTAGQTLDKSAMIRIIKNGMNAVDSAHIHMSMDMGSAGQSMTADGEMQSSPLEEKLDMNLGPMQMQAVLLDGTMYMKSSQLPTGGKWVKMTAKDMGKMGMSGISSGMSNPLGMIDQITPYITSAKYVGDDSTGKHYTLTVDMQGAIKKMGLPTTGAGASVPSSATEDLWLDDQGRPVKVDVTMGSLGKVTTTMSDFGAPVHIQAPPKSQVTGMSGLGGGSLHG